MDVLNYSIIAADYQAVAMDLQGVSANQLTKVKNRLDSAKTLLEAADIDPESTDLTTLTRHSLTGDILQTGAMGYMAMTNVQSKLLAMQSDIIYYREPSYGTFSTSASLSYFFLQPQNVKFGAVVMDMDRMANSAECQSNCWNNWSEFNQQSGAMMSALEHVIPEQLFSTAENPAEAISAVKALSVANAQGQKIYTLTSENFSSVSAQINYHSDDMKNEIISAINEGKTVTVHEAPLSYSGWNGMGYIVIDPETGAGAYKISSGANGGVLNQTL